MVSPLPDPKDPVAVEWWRRKSEYLSKSQIEKIMTLIIDEAQTSRNSGLFLRPEDLDFEILFWLTFINLNGGPGPMKRHRTFEDAMSFATQAQDEEFKTLNRLYFDQIKNSHPKIIESNNAYQVHLEDVRARILNAVYQNQLPLA